MKIYDSSKLNKHLIWALAITLIVIAICIMIMYSSSHPFIIRFEMDNNTLEAVKSLNYTNLS